MDRYGSERTLDLNSMSFDNQQTGFVVGYASSPTIDAAVTFLFSDGTNNVYVYIPLTTTVSTSVDVVDLTSTKAPMNALAGWDGSGSLTPFNFFDYTDYNQWYTQVIGTNTVLVNKFVYKITATNSKSTNAQVPGSTLASLTFDASTAAATGDKLCYASPSNGNVLHILFSSKHPSEKVMPSGSSSSESSSTGFSTSSQILLPKMSSIAISTPTTSGLPGHGTQS